MLPIRKNQNWLPDIFNDFFNNSWMEKTNATAPAINVLEHENGYSVEVAAPGMTKDDFQIHVDDNDNLIISMEKKTDNQKERANGRYLRCEFSYSKFQQSIILPENVDKEHISAKVEHGVLTVELPKLPEREERETVRKIDIQ